MKLFGKDVTTEKVMTFVAERLEARGLVKPPNLDVPSAGVEPRVDPLTFYVSALEENADATRGLPLETHRDGLGGRAVLLAKKMFRAAGQVFINEALGRQRVFNGHVRDSYAQLASEVLRLRARVEELEAQQDAAAAQPVSPSAVETRARQVGAAGKTALAEKSSSFAKRPAPVAGGRPRASKPARGKAAAGSKRVVAPRGQVAVGAKPAGEKAVGVAVAGEARPGALGVEKKAAVKPRPGALRGDRSGAAGSRTPGARQRRR